MTIDVPAAARRPLSSIDQSAMAVSAAADLLRGGDLAAAQAGFAGVLDRTPDCPDALLGLGMALIGQGDVDRARRALLRCCAEAPARAEAWDALGLLHEAAGEHAAAEAALAQAQALSPTLDVALRRIAAALRCDRGPALLEEFEAAGTAAPLDAVLLTARGALLCRLGRAEDAIGLLELATLLDPSLPGAALEYAVAVTDADPPARAAAALERAIALAPPDSAVMRQLRNNLGVVLMRLHRHAEASALFGSLISAAEAADRVPEPSLLCNLSNALVSLGEQDAALAAAREAARLAPGLPLAWRAVCNALAYIGEGGAAAMLAAAQAASASIARGPAVPLVRDLDPNRRLRVGLLSCHLRTHPVGWLTIAGFEHLDPAAFELVAIAQRPSGDPIARRFQAVAAEWHVAEAGPEAVARQARGLGLDLLIDLGGYGDRGLMTACAQRLAPVQLKWVGMQNHSSGLPEMDWFVTDRWETPPEAARHYAERLLMLPDGYVCYSPPAYAPDVAPAPAMRREAATFGCFNNLAKVTPEVIRTWSRILARSPGTRIVLKTHQLADPATRGRVMDAFAAQGIESARVVLRGGSAHRTLLVEYADVDIVLDPFPYTGGLTTCEALWMGVPTVTLAGDTFAARHAASHMSNVGLADWVATDLAGYEALAVARAADAAALADLRAGLRARVRASPLCDAPRFGVALGTALRAAWTAHCAEAPQSS